MPCSIRLQSLGPFLALPLLALTPQFAVLERLDASLWEPQAEVHWVLRERGTHRVGIPIHTPDMVGEQQGNTAPTRHPFLQLNG